jgi:hypothetical protein
MFNTLGRVLVVAFTALSLLLLTWSVSLYLNGIDWGWVSPRVELDQRIASEYDKSVVAFNDAVKMRDHALAVVPAAQAALRAAEAQFPANHLYYVAELKRLQTAPEPIEVKAIGSALALDKAGKLGKPVLDTKVDEVTKSYQAYLGDLKKTYADIDAVEADLREVVEKSKKLTFQLTGKDDAGKKVQHGLYDLIDIEYRTQTRLKEEREYLRPIWSQALNEAQGFAQRRGNLELTLERLKKAREKK